MGELEAAARVLLSAAAGKAMTLEKWGQQMAGQMAADMAVMMAQILVGAMVGEREQRKAVWMASPWADATVGLLGWSLGAY